MKLPLASLSTPLAHRALHGDGRPENSLAAIRAAIDARFGIEIDVQASADRQAMVFHDDVLDRLTDQHGAVRAFGADQLQNIPLSGGDEGIPTLPQILQEIAGRVPLLVEIKDQTGTMGPSDGQLEQTVAKAIEGYAGPLAVMSFNPHSVAYMAKLAPDVARGLTTSAFTPELWDVPPDRLDTLREIPDYDRVGASFISHEAADLDRPRVHELKSLGARILCWTIRSADQEHAARQVADNITFEHYRPA